MSQSLGKVRFCFLHQQVNVGWLKVNTELQLSFLCHFSPHCVFESLHCALVQVQICLFTASPSHPLSPVLNVTFCHLDWCYCCCAAVIFNTSDRSFSHRKLMINGGKKHELCINQVCLIWNVHRVDSGTKVISSENGLQVPYKSI